MAREVVVVLSLVIGDGHPDIRVAIHDLRGRELTGVPGSVITKVAVHEPDVLRARLGGAREPGADLGAPAQPLPAQLTPDEADQESEADFGDVTDTDS